MELAGASHFLEHLLFKGSATRSARDIAEAVAEVGGDLNAFTTKEYTAFEVRVLAEHLDLGLHRALHRQRPSLTPRCARRSFGPFWL